MSWFKGLFGESQMSDEDWKERGLQQTIAMSAGHHWTDANPDEDGVPTAGCYNGDYTDDQHEAANQKLDEDEYYEAEVETATRSLFSWFMGQDG
jgi:hypothetical protein